MSSVSSYVLDARVLSLFQGEAKCIQCDKELIIGDEVNSKRSGSGRRRMYCNACAVELYIIEPTDSDKLGTEDKT